MLKHSIQMTKPPAESLRCAVVGDGEVGKTCLIYAYATNDFLTHYKPTVVESYEVAVYVDKKPYVLSIFDTPGQEDYKDLRPLCYPKADVFLLCFSVMWPPSLQNVLEKWIQEIRRFNRPILLVGTKTDLRSEDVSLEELKKFNFRPITYQEGLSVARQLNAERYLECSALTLKGVKSVFDQALILATERDSTEVKKSVWSCCWS